MTETTIVKDDSPAADEAQRANAAAQAASDAAVNVAALATVEAANVQQQASERMAKFETELGQWRGLKEQNETLAAGFSSLRETVTADLNSLREQISSIQRPPPLEPEPLTNPPTDQKEEGHREGAAEPEPQRKKAHRWI